MGSDSDDDLPNLEAWLASRPTLVQQRSHPNHWFNRASDLHASAGALWLAMHSDGNDADRLDLGPGFSLAIACSPVYYMLCGLALELIMKARLVQLGLSEKEFGGHSFAKLLDLLRLEVTGQESKLLRFYEASMVWAGRYPVPLKATDKRLLEFWDLANDVLTDRVTEIKSIDLRRGNDAASWEKFHVLWQKYAALFVHR
jgi:hypothetical protein